MPGIFRISGQLSTVNKLYDHYAQPIDAADKEPKEPAAIPHTVTSALVPSHISHNVHDVAAVFKKFLNAVPGGILGSLSLFNALESIHKEFYANPDTTESHRREARARLIALAISSVTSQHRVSLICAVLGLAAVIGHETQTALDSNIESDQSPTTERMNYKGLGLVFAPLVIGDLTDGIELPSGGERAGAGALDLPNSLPKRRKENGRKPSVPKFPGMSTFLDMSGARYKLVAGVFEMLLINWRDVVAQMGGHAVPSQSVRSTLPPPPPPSAPSAPAAHSRQRSATHTRKASAPSIAAAHGFAIFLRDAPPSSTTTRAAPSSPRALRVGSVKQLVRQISRTATEPSSSSASSGGSSGGDETRPRREALMAPFGARQGSVKEAAQRLAVAAAASAAAPCPPSAAPRPVAAPLGSRIPKPVAGSRPPLPAVAASPAPPSSPPSVGEELRAARREAAMWRERAEWAERRLGFRMGVGGGVVSV